MLLELFALLELEITELLDTFSAELELSVVVLLEDSIAEEELSSVIELLEISSPELELSVVSLLEDSALEEELLSVIEDELNVFLLLLLNGSLESPRELLEELRTLELLGSSASMELLLNSISSPPVLLSPPQAARKSANTPAPKSVIAFVEKMLIDYTFEVEKSKKRSLNMQFKYTFFYLSFLKHDIILVA
jgi:hypothetical protein